MVAGWGAPAVVMFAVATAVVTGRGAELAIVTGRGAYPVVGGAEIKFVVAGRGSGGRIGRAAGSGTGEDAGFPAGMLGAAAGGGASPAANATDGAAAAVVVTC